ncbi:GNAT family protein [Bacillus massilinigeriensis]|uniref:hypothetical protein n=1 Tax=Bacillus massilionigeriensis TaxID=1805475 RepID=UPI00096B6620|nr:hypothetical protein [Bacillus massilionigeriensis]
MYISLDELIGKHVRIVPMKRGHIKGLYDIGQIEDIWTHLPKTIQTLNDMESFVEEALEKKEEGKEFPFVILLHDRKIIGTTRFLEISNNNKRKLIFPIKNRIHN